MTSVFGCPYKKKCKSIGKKCATCKHNDNKKDYYEPEDDFWKPNICSDTPPYGPINPIFPKTPFIITCIR